MLARLDTIVTAIVAQDRAQRRQATVTNRLTVMVALLTIGMAWNTVILPVWEMIRRSLGLP